jgi:hypothetical protein
MGMRISKTLLEHGAMVDSKDIAMRAALEHEKVATAQLLLEQGKA